MEAAQIEESGSLAEEIESVMDEVSEVEATDTPETPEVEPVKTAEEPAPAETDQEESKLHPHAHWPDEVKEVFTSMTLGQQKAWLDRERQYSHGMQQKAQEVKSFKTFAEGFKQLTAPLERAWQMQGMSAPQGMQRLVAREMGLRENPQETMLALAKEYGVNLETAFQEAPYVDPTVQSLQDRIRQFEEREQRNWHMQQQAQQRQLEERRGQALRDFEQFAQVTDESGAPRYPYARDERFMAEMAQAMSSGRAVGLEQAYQVVHEDMLNHPLYQSQLKQVSQQQIDINQAKVERAKKASKVVEGTSADSQVTRSLREDILSEVEAQG